MSDINEVRERFEAWAEGSYHLQRMGDKYRSAITTDAWRAWQAAVAASPGGAAMTGPVIAVAWQSRFVDGKWSECSREHVEWVRSVPHEWPGYEVRELYAAPQPAIDLEQFREAVESLRLGATRAEHHEECDRLLALIDGQAGPDMIGDALSAMGSTYPLTGAGMQAALDGKQPTKGEGVADG